MTLKTYLWGMAVSAVFCFFSWLLVVFYINPVEEKIIGPVLFYLSLFFFLTSFFTLVGFCLKRKISKDGIEFVQTEESFRQGLFLALIFVMMLILQSFEMLNWWNAGLFVAGVSLLELYLQAKNK